MNTMKIRELHSIAELRAHAAQWDDLWLRSHVTIPLARAEFVAHWVESFAPHAAFRAVVVEQDGRFIAALPLVVRRVKRVFKVHVLPNNHWGRNGDLLLDADCEQDAALDMLLRHLGKSRPLLWFDRVAYDEPQWLKFQDAIQRAGWLIGRREAFRTATIEIGDDFDAYEASLAAAHRRNCRSRAKSLEKIGEVKAVLCDPTDSAAVDAMVRRAFEVEDRSWKGAAGTSVLKSPGMLEYYQAEARIAAALGHLDLSLLEVGDRAVAAAYSFYAKGTCFEVKLGYDDEFKKFGPGHLLLRHKLRRLFADSQAVLLDCHGPLIPWITSWTESSYSVGRLVATQPHLVGRTLFKAYDEWWPRLRSRLRPTVPTTAEPTAVETN